MQPLTPAERRFLERMKNDISMNKIVRIDFNGQDMTNEEKLGYKELWLKVLTMVLECNEALETEWRRAYDAPGGGKVGKMIEDAKRRLRR